jgi:glycine/D-amino acid oxidase-like deaminating enzyme
LFPAKWIWEVFQRLIKSKAVQLYTQTPVTAVKSTPIGKWAVHTENKGIIVAKTVIHCTNGWMGHLLPELREACFPVSEQVMALKLPNQIWKEKGFVWHSVAHYLIQRDKDNIVIVGGGRSTIDGKNRPFVDHETVDFLGTGLGGMIRANDSSIYPVLHTDIRQFLRSHFPNEVWPEYEEAEWAGVQGYTKDHLPYIGPLEHAPNQFISAGYNGHGEIGLFITQTIWCLWRYVNLPFSSSYIGMPLCWWSGRRVAEMVSGKCNAADDIANLFLPRQRINLPSA